MLLGKGYLLQFAEYESLRNDSVRVVNRRAGGCCQWLPEAAHLLSVAASQASRRADCERDADSDQLTAHEPELTAHATRQITRWSRGACHFVERSEPSLAPKLSQGGVFEMAAVQESSSATSTRVPWTLLKAETLRTIFKDFGLKAVSRREDMIERLQEIEMSGCT